MSQYYVGEIILVPYNFVPLGFLPCDGSLQDISVYDTLFNLIGTTYGGDGQTTFATPDLRGRVPIHVGQGPNLSTYILGQMGGTETVALTSQQIPSHNHLVDSSALAARLRCQTANGTQAWPTGNVLAREAAGVTNPYSTLPADSAMSGPTFPLAGAATIASTPVAPTQGHSNLQPILCLTYCIAWSGVFPTQ